MKILCVVIFLSINFSIYSIAQVNYDTEIQTIFTQSCGGGTCHISISVAGVNMSSYQNVISSMGDRYDMIVIPFNASESPLIEKLNPDPTGGDQMPLEREPLTLDQIELITRWINEGAVRLSNTSIERRETPTEFKLVGNFPNPFNPITQIQFDVPEPVQYTISIYSLHGRLISEQVGNASAGRVQVPINLTSSPTGIYYYRVSGITGGSRFEIGSGKMSLIK